MKNDLKAVIQTDKGTINLRLFAETNADYSGKFCQPGAARIL